jgi:hypothetical protein
MGHRICVWGNAGVKSRCLEGPARSIVRRKSRHGRRLGDAPDHVVPNNHGLLDYLGIQDRYRIHNTVALIGSILYIHSVRLGRLKMPD